MGKIKGFFCKKIMIPVFLLLGAVAFLVPYGIKTASAKSNNRKLPIYCVGTEEKKVALSFDAAWGNEDTEAILEILKKHDVKVTFFMTGGWIESYPEDVKKILAAGHDIGNHSENHKHMERLSSADCERELMIPHEKVESLTGYNMCLFRPPYGGYNDTLINTAEKCGYYTIQWSVDTLYIKVMTF
jgi:peptidoglycan/xylan/chitin deacetylase (PgdA/CDA1 family)